MFRIGLEFLLNFHPAEQNSDLRSDGETLQIKDDVNRRQDGTQQSALSLSIVYQPTSEMLDTYLEDIWQT